MIEAAALVTSVALFVAGLGLGFYWLASAVAIHERAEYARQLRLAIKAKQNPPTTPPNLDGWPPKD